MHLQYSSTKYYVVKPWYHIPVCCRISELIKYSYSMLPALLPSNRVLLSPWPPENPKVSPLGWTEELIII